MHAQIMTCPSFGYINFDYIRMPDKFYLRKTSCKQQS